MNRRQCDTQSGEPSVALFIADPADENWATIHIALAPIWLDVTRNMWTIRKVARHRFREYHGEDPRGAEGVLRLFAASDDLSGLRMLAL
jgi:hypothetical protein